MLSAASRRTSSLSLAIEAWHRRCVPWKTKSCSRARPKDTPESVLELPTRMHSGRIERRTLVADSTTAIRQHVAERRFDNRRAVRHRGDRPLQQIRIAHECCREQTCRSAVNAFWRPDILNPTPVQQHDRVGDGHRLFLIVRDMDERRRQRSLQRMQLGLHLAANFDVQRSERLVEQEDGRARSRWPAPARHAGAGRRTAHVRGGCRSPQGQRGSGLPRPGVRARAWAHAAFPGRISRCPEQSCEERARSLERQSQSGAERAAFASRHARRCEPSRSSVV